MLPAEGVGVWLPQGDTEGDALVEKQPLLVVDAEKEPEAEKHPLAVAHCVAEALTEAQGEAERDALGQLEGERVSRRTVGDTLAQGEA